MKLAKSLFLGSVAGLAAVAGAQAADLPVAKAAAVEYVRVCSTYGAGFFYIPGTETCLRVGGRVRAEYRYLEPLTRASDSVGFRARGRVALDARTATAYGLLRTYIRMEMDRNTGVYESAGSASTSANLAQAYIQFGGLTAGRSVSFFANGDLPSENFSTFRFYDYPDVNLLAYTFSFGNGFSASLSLEDGQSTNVGSGPAFNEAGQRYPDLVGNLKYSGTWGSAQLSAALHQSRSAAFDVAEGDFYDSELGWAIGAQVGINLPMLAAGDALWLAAAYADGAVGYLGFIDAPGQTSTTVAETVAPIFDIFIDADGDAERTTGWSIAGGLRHYWTPTIRSNLMGSYADVEGIVDFNEWRVGANTIWSPVSGLNIGVEVLYANIDVDGPVFDDLDDDRWEGRLRIQRDF